MRTRRRLAALGLVAAVIAGSVACSDDSDSSSEATTTTSNRGFEVDTPEGQVSLSLSGQLPPNWPDDFPIPSGAEPAGSGSLGGTNTAGLVGVYSTDASAEETYAFYRDSTELQIDSSTSVGGGTTYLGTVQFSGEFNGSVVVLPYGDQTLMVVLLSQDRPGTTIGNAGTNDAS
jgi:hypothetical protein